MNKILFIISVIVTTGFYAKSQSATNIHFEVGLQYFTNYDFDLNRPTGIVVRDNGFFKIDIGEEGRGRFYYLSSNADGGMGQKIIYTISNAEYKTYSDGSRFLKINSYWEDGSQITIMVNYKTNKNKNVISSIAMIGSNNEGTLHY